MTTPPEQPDDAPVPPAAEHAARTATEGAGSPPSETPARPGVGRRLFKKVIAHPFGKLAGVVVGALIGIGVQAGVESTGVLGPGVDALIEKQEANFALIDAKLESLRSAGGPEAKALAKELEGLVAAQRALSDRAADELRGARQQDRRLQDEALATRGSAMGADLWLKPGEAATVGAHGTVFSFLRYSYSGNTLQIETIADGTPARLTVGEAATLPTKAGDYRVLYKQSEPRADGRVGFDVVPPDKAG